MKHRYTNGRIRNFAILIASMALLLSCSDSDCMDEPAVDSATIKIATRVTADEDIDNTIKSLRIMAFERGSVIKNNIFYDEAYLNSNNPIIHEMLSGVYDFVLIANEMPDGSQNPELTGSAFAGNKTINNLNEIAISASVINQNNVIPMLTRVDNVTVLPGLEGIRVDDGAVQTTWSVLMKRLAVRIDITLKSKVDLSEEFKTIEFTNIPDNIPLLGNYSGPQNTTKFFMPDLNPDNFEKITVPGYLWAMKIKRIILPSNTFSPEDMASRALKMTVILSSWSGDFPTATIGIDEPTNYTLPPNTQFMGEGIIGPLLGLNLNAFDWDTKDILGDINGRILNVSTLNPMISLDKPERVYFYTNQKKVSINPQGYFGASAFDVDDVFQALLEENNTGTFYFDATTGVGYIDLTPQPSVSTSGIYVIYLNAGGLIRTLSVNISTR